MDTEPRWGDTLDADIELIRAAAAAGAALPAPEADPTPAPQPGLADEAAEAPAAPQASAELDRPAAAARSGDLQVPSSISGLAGKLVETRGSRERWTAKTARQMASTAALLVRVVGHDEFARLRQQDFAIFRDVLGRLPVSYGKSSRDREKPISEILAAAQRLPALQRGREAGTINRHFNHLGALLKFASGYGLNCAEPIDLSYFYEPNTERARDQRPAMTLDDVATIVQSGVWRGCASERDRLNAGDVVIHDALYWVPLIAIFSLMRREEACGLRTDDVHFDAAIPFFILAPNRYRRLKNLQSKERSRSTPELMRLGLRAIRRGDQSARLRSAVSRAAAGERRRAARRPVS